MKNLLKYLILTLLFFSLFACKAPKPPIEEVKESLEGVMFVLYFTSFTAEMGQSLEGVSISVKEEGQAWEIRLKQYLVQDLYDLRKEYFGDAPTPPSFSHLSGVYKIAPDNNSVSADLKLTGSSIKDVKFQFDSTHFQKLNINGHDFKDEVNQLIDTEGFLKQ